MCLLENLMCSYREIMLENIASWIFVCVFLKIPKKICMFSRNLMKKLLGKKEQIFNKNSTLAASEAKKIFLNTATPRMSHLNKTFYFC